MEQSSSTVARSEKKPIACIITRRYDEFKISTYNVETKKSDYFWSKDNSIHEIIAELITKYGNDIGIIFIYNEDGYFKKEDFKKYGNLVHLATKEELDFNYYLEEKVEYSVGELIIQFYNKEITLYQCTTAVEGRVTWKELDERKHGFNDRIDFEYAARMFGLRMNQVHVVFQYSRENVNELYGSELDKYSFKSINFIQWARNDDKSLFLARHLISDPEVSVLVKTEYSDKTNLPTYTIEDCKFIHIPKLVEEYEARTDIMGIDLGSTRSVLAVSRNKQIHIIPVDNSSPGDLWTESVVSFDEEKPIIGRAAVRRLRTKPDHVIFDHKLLYNQSHRYNILNQSIWPFKYNLKEDQPYLGSQTCQGLEDFSLSKINAIFLERMAKAASEYQDVFNNGNSVRKAVITVPIYFNHLYLPDPLISSAIEAAKLANIEVIDIIEETHADFLYYLSNERYSEMIKPGKKIAIFDIGGGTCVCRVYQVSEYKGKMYATCIRESHEIDDAKWSGRAIDNIIIKELEESIAEDLRSDVKLRTLEAAKKIKHDLSFEEKTEFDLSDIHPCLEGIVEFTRKWFEEKLKMRFENNYDLYITFNLYPLPTQRKDRCVRNYEIPENAPFDDVDILFLAGGTCRIPFVQEWIKEQFPKAKPVIDGQLEIITATGAAIHALQVLSGEVEPYIRSFEHPIVCTVTRNSYEFTINIYGIKTKQKLNYSRLGYNSIHEIIAELITKYGNDIGIIFIYNEDGYFKKEDFKKYGNLVHLATKEELDFNYYLEEKVEYSVGELIIQFYNKEITLYQCTTAVEGRVTWKELDERKHGFNDRIDFEYIERMFGLRMNHVHVVFQYSRENVNELYGSELDKYSFKSINFIKGAVGGESLFLARHLISDPEVSVLVKTEYSDKTNLPTYTIEDWNFIYIPKLVEEYKARTDIMGIDLGSTRSVLAVSRNKEIQIVSFDESSPGDLWTESVVSFDEEKPIIGKAAVRRFRTKPDHVIFDHKLLCNKNHQEKISEQSIWPFKFSFKEDQPHLGSQTCQGLKDFSLAEINKIFLERMEKAASDYQDVFNNGNSVRKAVITVPIYFNHLYLPDPLISSAIEAAKLANIEVIDIIEETHADLLYYLSNDRYSEMIKPGKKIAIFDIGGGTRIWRVYKISEHEGKMYATCIRESHEIDDAKWSGRAIDNIIIEELEKSIPEDLRSSVKLRTLEAAKKIKHDLSFEEKREFNLWEIDSHLERIVEFTREWFEGKLKLRFGRNYYGNILFKSRFENNYYYTFKLLPLPSQRKDRCNQRGYWNKQYAPFDDVDIVFLAGGTCRIPFVKKWVKEQFPKAKMIIDGQLEIITATGAAIHALQVLSGEVEPYIKVI